MADPVIPPADAQTQTTNTAVQEEHKITDPAKLSLILEERKAKIEHYRQKTEAQELELSKFRQEAKDREARTHESQQEAERKALATAGKYEEAQKLLNSQWESKHSKTVQEIFDTAKKALIPNAIKGALAKANVVPEAIDDLAELLQGKVEIDPKTFQPFVKGPDGTPLRDEKTMEVISIEEFTSRFVASKPIYKADQMLAGTGTKAGGKSAVGNVQFTPEAALASRAVMEKWMATDPVGCKAAMRSYRPESK